MMQNKRYLLTEQGSERWITVFGSDGIPIKTYSFQTNCWRFPNSIESIQIQREWPHNKETSEEDAMLELI